MAQPTLFSEDWWIEFYQVLEQAETACEEAEQLVKIEGLI
jgi:hypothetical protein